MTPGAVPVWYWPSSWRGEINMDVVKRS